MSNFAVYLLYLRTFTYFGRTANLQSRGICSNSTPVVCCNNYHLVGNECKECDLGYFEDCLTKCPAGQYGSLCVQSCSCIPNLCDHVTGCPVVPVGTTTDEIGHCPDKDNGCCLNYYKDGAKCKECPLGYYDYNCSQICPAGYYGENCISTCETCNISLCDHVDGCTDLTANNSSSDDSLHITVVVILPVTFVVITAGIVGVIFLCKRRKIYEPKHINNASQRQSSRREDRPVHTSNHPSQPSPCQQEIPGATIELYDENSENPYAQISDTARLLPRTKHCAKEVSIPTAPLMKDEIQGRDPYDILSLKVKGRGHSEMRFDSHTKDTGWSGVNGICPDVTSTTTNRRGVPSPPIRSPIPNARRSFLFPRLPSELSSGYVSHNSCKTTGRSSEAEVEELPLPPPPPTFVSGNNAKPKKGRKPLPPPRKLLKDSPVCRTDDQGESQTEHEGIVNLRHQNEMHDEAENVTMKTRTSLFTQNNIFKNGPSLKMLLRKDKRKSNVKSYNVSGLLDVEDMPPPDFNNDVESSHVSGEQLPCAENQTNVFRKCQTALKTKMNRISALRFANGTLGNLRYSFARPTN